MTICLENRIKSWNGADGEHLELSDVPEGSTFHAVDVGKKYIFHNGGWAEDLRDIYTAKTVLT